MDSKKLILQLQPFLDSCEADGRKLDEFCLDEAFPGDNSTSYILKVKSSWIDGVFCYSAIEYLFNKLWETSSPEVVKNIFAIQVMDVRDQIRCSQEMTQTNVVKGEESLV